MRTQIEKLTGDFVNNLLRAVATTSLESLSSSRKGKPRGLAALPVDQRRVIARKAAATRKRREAARKAVITRRANAHP
jgi:hypothetical protein